MSISRSRARVASAASPRSDQGRPRFGPLGTRGSRAGLAAPLQQLVQRHGVQHVTQMVGGDIGIGQGPVSGQAQIMVQPLGTPQIAQHLVGKARQLRPQAQGAFPGADPVRRTGHVRGAETLLEAGPVGGQRARTPFRPQNIGGHIPPVARAGHPFVEDMMHGHGAGRDRPPRIDETGPARHGRDLPCPVRPLLDILPADLADIRRAASGGLQVDDPDAGDDSFTHSELCEKYRLNRLNSLKGDRGSQRPKTDSPFSIGPEIPVCTGGCDLLGSGVSCPHSRPDSSLDRLRGLNPTSGSQPLPGGCHDPSFLHGRTPRLPRLHPATTRNLVGKIVSSIRDRRASWREGVWDLGQGARCRATPPCAP